MPTLALDAVVKRYGAALGVGPISLKVEPGELLSLLGPSGCGKTTTLHLIAGLLMPDEGAIRMGDRDLTAIEPPDRDMGLVFQNYALFPHKTVAENVAFGLRMRGRNRTEITSSVRRMLDIVGLPNVEERMPDQLSGGQRQRVALARALVIEPSVLLLDEPLSNLDALLRKRMRTELREIQQRVGIMTIFVTHDQEEAFEISDRVALLNLGRIEQLGRPEALYDSPASRFVAEFIGEGRLLDVNVLNTSRTRCDVELEPGVTISATCSEGALVAGGRAQLLIRPERVDLAEQKTGDGAISVTITKRSFSGDRIILELDAGNGRRLLAHRPSVAAHRALTPGRKLWATPGECWAMPVSSP
jgi:ABC-type Fe3+/spermidine/putrescine transport system ATPase subunit